MTAAADLLLTNAEVHTLTDDGTAEAVAVRDGRIVRVGAAYDVAFLAGTETEVLDLDGRVLLPGFVDAHTHLLALGRRLVHADLSGAQSREACLDRLRARAGVVGPGEWVLGFGYDESEWGDDEFLSRADLDAVDAGGPVVAVREDHHVVSLDSAALDRLGENLPAATRESGVASEAGAEAVLDAVAPDAEETRDCLLAAQAHANERGVTAVHEMVRRSRAPRVYRELDRAGELTLRVRLNYWADHLDALEEVGLRTNHGSGLVDVGAVKTLTDGSLGGRTARLSEPYADGEGRGEWVVDPADLAALVARADDLGYQVAAHAIGDEAVDAVLDAYAARPDPGAARHRIEHAELASEDALSRMADLGVVASMQPNFHRWARPGGLYERRLGDRRTETNRFRDVLDAGVPLAFGSDCMPLDPLYGVHESVNAPTDAGRLTVDEALRAYTAGAAYAGFDEDRTGTVEPGTRADLVALDGSPWANPDAIADLGVALTVVDGRVAHDGR